MNPRQFRLPIVSAFAGAAISTGASARDGPEPRLASIPVASGLTLPAVLAAAPGDRSRLFIGELHHSGGQPTRADIRILSLETGQLLATPFLSITVTLGGEDGLLGLAFDPAYATNGYFYVHYSFQGSRITRYRVSNDPNIADPGSAAEVLVTTAGGVHNAGWTAFGPDEYLYTAIGDHAHGANAQNLTILAGKILRIDVRTLPYTIPPTNPYFGSPTTRPEIWAMGLRNPWRCGFDRVTGDLWIGDVGNYLGSAEEINFQPAAVHPPFVARNYGWPCANGLTNGCIPNLSVVPPIHSWMHTGGYEYVVGGYVYRGAAVPELRGSYFFWREGNDTIWTLRYDGQQVTELIDRTAELTPSGGALHDVVTFGEDAAGELYLATIFEGRVYKIVPRCPANCDGSVSAPVLTIDDFACFTAKFVAADPYADCSADGSLTVADFGCYQGKYVLGCP